MFTIEVDKMETKKLGLVIAFVLALLITVGSALALTFDETAPESPFVMKDGDSQTFSVTMNNPDDVMISYQWSLDGDDVGMDSDSYIFDAPSNEADDYVIKVTVNDDSELTKSWNVHVADRPVDISQFPGAGTTALDTVADPTQVENFVLENSFGTIEFTGMNGKVDLSEILKLVDYVSIEDGKVSVDSGDLPTDSHLELGGKVTVKKTYQKPVILKSGNDEDFEKCTVGCTVVSNGNGKFVFTVAGFSTYQVVEAADFEISEILFNDVLRGKTVLTTFTFKNNGTVETLSNVSVQLVDVNSKYAALITEGLSGDELVLSPGEPASVTLQIKVPDDEDTNKHSIGTFKVMGTNEDNQPVTKEAQIYVLPKSFLDITKVKVNGKTTGDLSLEDVNDVTVEVKNEYTEDMDDVTITVELLDVDGDDLEEESDEFELKDGDEQEETFEFDLQGEDLDEEEYVLEVTVEGEADDGTVHITVEKYTLNVEREKHQVIITQAELSSTLLQCSATKQLTLDVEIKNVGKSDEDDLEIKVRNDDLAINLVKSDIELDKYSGDDTEYSKSFQILLDR